jgi:hypothetical protein
MGRGISVMYVRTGLIGIGVRWGVGIVRRRGRWMRMDGNRYVCNYNRECVIERLICLDFRGLLHQCVDRAWIVPNRVPKRNVAQQQPAMEIRRRQRLTALLGLEAL